MIRDGVANVLFTSKGHLEWDGEEAIKEGYVHTTTHTHTQPARTHMQCTLERNESPREIEEPFGNDESAGIEEVRSRQHR